MIVSVVSGVAIALATGFLTGFYFERRGTRTTRRQNEELREQLRALRRIVLGLGADQNGAPPAAAPDVENLMGDLIERAVHTQDPSGRVNLRSLRQYLMDKGFPSAEIEAALASLCDGGTARLEGAWLKLI